jgi:hypothetical protein
MFLVSGMDRLFFLALGLYAAEVSLAASDSTISVAAVAAARKIDAGAMICVTPVQNLTGREILTGRIDEVLISQIIKVGYRAAKLAALETCDARAYTELVHIEGRDRTKVEIEFRLVFAGEQVPRLCTTAVGKSAKRPKSLRRTDSLALAKRARVAAEREAIESACASQAQKIQSAQREGMAPYTDSIQRER